MNIYSEMNSHRMLVLNIYSEIISHRILIINIYSEINSHRLLVINIYSERNSHRILVLNIYSEINEIMEFRVNPFMTVKYKNVPCKKGGPKMICLALNSRTRNPLTICY